MATWNFILTDSTTRPVGEILNASDRTVSLPLNKLDSLSFKVRLDNPLADQIIGANCYIKAYRNRELRYIGPIISVEESAERDTQSVVVNSAGAGWILGRRLAGKSVTGRQFTSLTDRAVICQTLINESNTENATGVWHTRDGANSSASLITYTAGPYKPIMDIINELSASYDGFDWRIYPAENFANGVLTNSYFSWFVAKPVLGAQKPDAIFEYGVGRHNVESYKRTVNRDTMANRVYSVSQDAEAGTVPVVSATDAGSITTWRMVEDLVQSDLAESSLRQQLVNEHVLVRRAPRTVIEFTPHVDPYDSGRLPRFGTDFDVGDWVRARAVYHNAIRFDAMFRVWGVSFNIDANGLEKMTLVLVENQ